MKVLPALVTAFGRSRRSRYNLRLLLQVGGLLMILVIAFSVIFQLLMAVEGREYTWLAAFYWTIETMTTLGYGDITFSSDLGRVYTIIVLLTGVLMLLVVFPFTFIEALYVPWLEARKEAHAPRRLPRFLRGHVILTSSDPISLALIRKLDNYHYSYALLVPDFEAALSMADRGINVMVGELDDPETYRKAQIEIASLAATSCTQDSTNTNVVSTIRQLSESIPIVATAQDPSAVNVLRLAGATHVLQPSVMLGKSLARRAYGGRFRAHVIARYDSLEVAEATVHDTVLAGKRLIETGLREHTGLNVLGAWERGIFENASSEMLITENTVLVLAGSEKQLARFNEFYPQPEVSDKPVVIIGGGRVGQATALALEEMGIACRIIEHQPEPNLDTSRLVTGNAVELDVLRRAGFDEAPTAIITTRDDDINIYLTIYLRSLRPDILIISRSMKERNLATLHRSGADFVMSHASMGANSIFNMLRRSDIEMLAEGLDLFRVPLPKALAGKSIANGAIRERTGCSVVALCLPAGMEVNPDPFEPLPAEAELLLIGTVENETRFLERYPASQPIARHLGDQPGGH